ncbi:cysteine synthase a [Trichoderma arundinaceum]|uniref:Cysteine synthase a n=1 Tax=Trichoderma arundinaceum TaxID=490622 RepID=A0A395NGK3_TRIAR|nr:cysteine synthase a [Trichoderma arundinaceum]
MIEQAEKRGDLKSGMTVVEATGGSTGSSLAFICALKGTGSKCPSGKVIADLMPSMMQHAMEIGKKEGYYYTNQFHNRDALIGYEGIGHELVKQFPGGIDAFCGAIGTAGMATGVARVFRSTMPSTRIIILEPASAPHITQGRTGAHSVEGIAVVSRPPHLDQALYDEARGIEEEEARAMCRLLARKEGLLVGTSTGINVVAAIQLAKELGVGKTVVTVAVDTGLKYSNGNLFQE